MEENIEKIWKIRKKPKLNSEKIGKIWKKIVKWYGIYRRKLWSDMENIEENSEKWKDMENMEEKWVEMWNDMENMEEKYVEMWNDMENTRRKYRKYRRK